jgi:hypothetical protein
MQVQFITHPSKIHFNCSFILFFITQVTFHQTAFEKNLYSFLRDHQHVQPNCTAFITFATFTAPEPLYVT